MAVVVPQVVAHQTTDREVSSSIPTGSWAFSLIFFLQSLNQWCVLNQVPRGGATLLIFQLSKKKMEAQLCSLRQSKLNMYVLNETIKTPFHIIQEIFGLFRGLKNPAYS